MKKAIVGIVVFLLSGYVIFTFANPSDNEALTKESDDSKVTENSDNKENTDKKSILQDEEVVLEEEVVGNNLNNVVVNPVVENPVPDPLIAARNSVKKLEESLSSEDVRTATTLVTSLNESNEKTNLLKRIKTVVNTIHIIKLYKDLDAKVSSVVNPSDLKSVSNFIKENELETLYSDITNKSIFGQLQTIINNALDIVNDTKAPVFKSLVYGRHYKDNLMVEVDEKNLYTILVFNQDTNTKNYVNNNTVLEGDATYQITATDLNGNSTSVWVAKDTAKPEINILDGYYNSDKEVIISDKYLHTGLVTINDVKQNGISILGPNNKWGTFTKILSEEGKYEIIAKDQIGNETTRVIYIDKTKPRLVSQYWTKTVEASFEKFVCPTAYGTDNISLTENVKVELTANNVDLTKLGKQRCNYRTTDQAGNVSTNGIFITVEDTVAPVFTSLKTGKIYSNRVKVNVSDPTLSKIEVLNTDTNEVKEINNDDYVSKNGSYIVTAVDAAGNTTKVNFKINSLKIYIENSEDLTNAIINQKDNQTWYLAEGIYILNRGNMEVKGQTGWFMPLTANNLTINGNSNVVIKAGEDVVNGNWSTQNFITVIGNNITINKVKLFPQVDPESKTSNKAIEVLGENFTLTNSTITSEAKLFSGSIYIANPGLTTTLKNVVLDMGRITFSGADSTNKMFMNNVDILFSGSLYEQGYWGFYNAKNAHVEAVKSSITVSNQMVGEMNEFINGLPDDMTVLLSDGIYNLGHLQVDNKIVLTGSSINTILNVDSDPISGQAGIYFTEDSTFRNCTVNMSNSKLSAIKASYGLETFNINRVYINGGKGLNIHGVNNATVERVNIQNSSGVSLSVAASNVKVINSVLTDGAWKSSIGVMYKPNDEFYKNSSTVMIDSKTKLGNSVYIEYAKASGSKIIFEDDSKYEEVYDEGKDILAYIKKK
jgi:hypothetical protein